MTHIWLEQEVAPYVSELFHKSEKHQYPYHNLKHTKEVVMRAQETAHAENVPDGDIQILITAAWFHDTGHLNGGIEKHEERSVVFMKNFMEAKGVDDAPFIQCVADCIMATAMPQKPTNKLQEIMCDADTYHFGTGDFRKSNKDVKKELKLRHYDAHTKGWNKKALALLEQHQFFTGYAKQLLGPGKAENMRWLRDKVNEKEEEAQEVAVIEKEQEAAVAIPSLGKKEEKEQQLKAAKFEEQLIKKEQAGLLSKGVQTMLRIMSGNHLRLSYLADRKANLLISVNAIIISIILSQLFRRLDAEQWMIIPTILFLITSVTTIIISILATMPKVSSGSFRKEDVEAKRTNLMFFGNFYKASHDDYEWAMNELMNDRDYVYNTMVRDVYYLGVVLGRKYKLIRIAYYVFMIGLVVSVAAFSIASIYAHGSTVTVTDGKTTPY